MTPLQNVSVIPHDFVQLAEMIMPEISESFGNPFYSIDCAMTPEGVKLIEFNNRPGFPTTRFGADCSVFIAEMAECLINIANPD